METLVVQAGAGKPESLPPELVERIPDIESVRGSSYLRWKAPLDRVLALLLLIPGMPAIGILALMIRATSSGSPIFRQPRVGRGGRIFTILKLRSMRDDAETTTGAVWSVPGESDPRLTRIGCWLRKWHLDELPQLINVVRGEMSLVGPRPERPEFVLVLAKKLPRYLDRLAATPGITGLAQINLLPDANLNDVERKLVLDQQYIQSANLLFDLRMLGCTLLRLLGVKGVIAAKVWRLERKAPRPPPAHDEVPCEYQPTPKVIDRESVRDANRQPEHFGLKR